MTLLQHILSFSNPYAVVFSIGNLLVNTALSMAFGEKSKLKLGGKY